VLAYGFVLIGIPFIILKRGSLLEKITIQIIILLRSSPLFWTGIFVLLIFSIGLKWFPLGGVRTPGSGSSFFSVDFLRHLALPCLVYSGYLVGLPALLLKERMEAELAKPYVDVVRAKGVRSSIVVYKHILKNSMLPILTTAGAIIGIALGGQLAIEVVFSWPGLGRAIVKAIQTRDFAIAQAVFLIIGMMVVLANLLVDLSYAFVDPRVTHD
jgi:peptide/nickel transport system permease protein